MAPATAPTDAPLRVCYRLSCAPGESAEETALAIAYEQTVELPAGSFPSDIEQRLVARVERLEPIGERRWDATLAFDPLLVGGEAPQLINLLFGNVSMYRGVKITAIDWPVSWLAPFGGPRHGIAGLRKLCGAENGRPLLCVALKPIGRSADELAELCHGFACAGVDLIKDDHGLADQRSAPFERRVEACQDAVERANAATGYQTSYFPHLGGRYSEFEPRLARLRNAGCRGVLISPLLVGWDVMRWIAEQGDLALLAHPSMSGGYFGADHGIAPEVLLGQLFRLFGADAVIYPNAGGRFPWNVDDCRRLHRTLRAEWPTIRPAFPMPGGGIDAQRVEEWVRAYGKETAFLIGGSLYAADDPAGEAARLVERLRTLGDDG